MRRRIGSMLLVLCMMAGVLMTGCGADNAEKKKGVETISPKGRMIATILLPLETSIPTAFINLSLLKIIAMDKPVLLIAYSIYCGVTRMRLRRFNLHKTNAANEELVISLFYGREVQERKPIYQLLHHYTA